jgi:SAM-dependent methyltransferase
LAENLRTWAEYRWERDGDEWSAPWGSSHVMWAATILPRIAHFLPAGRVLEIAPGRGRCTQFLAPLCERLIVVDVVRANITACRERFARVRNIDYHLGDGCTLPFVPDASLDFAFSWDSLVHVDAEVLAGYLRELARTLKPGAFAFIHHSNYASILAAGQKVKDLHGRDPSTSSTWVADACPRVGLHCRVQELLPWGGMGLLDCFSLVERPRNPWALRPEPVRMERTGFYDELWLMRGVSSLYGATLGPHVPYMTFDPRRRILGAVGGVMRRLPKVGPWLALAESIVKAQHWRW